MAAKSEIDGFDDLFAELEKMSKRAEDPIPALSKAADAFVSDARSLPSPRSKRNGVKHLLDTIDKREQSDCVETGWGKYYGRMVEKGTVKMGARPHMIPLWDRNKEKYYKIMEHDLLD